MKLLRLIAVVPLLALLLSAQQVQRPPVYFGGPLGPGGPFPLANSGTINMPSDANYTMVYPDTSASVIRITSAVPLTATRSIIAPQAAAPFFGFEFVIENLTTGGQSITVIGTTGTGVTIPNGRAQLVIYDGTNYISVGSLSNVSPFIVYSVDGSQNLTIGVPNTGGGNPAFTSTTGTVNTANLLVTDLIGTGVSCVQVDELGNLGRAGPPCGSGGGGGWGFVVPTAYARISDAIAAAATAGGGPVVVLPTSTDFSAYTNPTNLRVDNYKQNAGGADSRFFRDASEWGVIDGRVLNCNTTAGSPIVTCSGPFVNAPAPAGEIGKLIVIMQAGAGTYGQLSNSPAMAVASTAGVTAPGPPNTLQPVTFTNTNNGCTTIDTMPYAHVQLNASGLPAGPLQFNNWAGKGCTAAPTQGTVGGVTGTVTFSGGSIAHGDLVGVVVNVNTATNQLTLDTNATFTTGGQAAYYGTDAHDTLQAACNDLSKGDDYSNGTLTLSGIAMISRGVDCNGAGLEIKGRAAHGLGSAIVYAGKTPNPPPNTGTNNTIYPTSYILNVSQGGQEKVQRVHLIGNSQGMPYGLVVSFGSNGNYQSPGTGANVNAVGVIDQVSFNPYWGDPIQDLGTMRMQSCIFNAAFEGNGDFWQVDRISCFGADAFSDGVNDQATNWHWGQLDSRYNNWGFIPFGAFTEVKDYYTEFNRVDFSSGSPYWPNAGANYLHIISYGGESSAMEFEPANVNGPWHHAFGILVDGGGLGGAQSTYGRPDGISMDLSTFNSGGITYGGYPRGIALIPTGCGEGGAGSNSWGIDLYANINQIQFQPNGGSCGPNGYGGGGYLTLRNAYSAYPSVMKIPLTSEYSNLLQNNSATIPTMLEVNHSQSHIGSLSVVSPHWNVAQSGYGQNLLNYCNGAYQSNYNNTPTCGTTTYNYQITCTDSLGNEILPSPVYPGEATSGPFIFTTLGGPPSLNATSTWMAMVVWPLEGCPLYNLYGDEGTAGGIGFLATVPAQSMTSLSVSYPNLAILDQGRWTKNTARKPPVATQSGKTTVGNLAITSLLSAPGLGTDAQGNVIPSTGGGGGTANATYVLAGPTLGANPVPPAILQSHICAAAAGTTVVCPITATQAGSLLIVGPPYHSSAVSDNLGQTYLNSVNYPLQTVFYKENTAAGVTQVTTTVPGPGGAVVILEVSQIAGSNSLDQDLWNVGNITGSNTPITWSRISTSNPADFVLGYWTCAQNSVTQPTAAPGWTLGGYQATTGNSWSGGFVWQNATSIGAFRPQVSTANCPVQQASMVLAFKASLVGTAGPIVPRPLVSSDLPQTPWSALGEPADDYLTTIEMRTGATLMNWNIAATNTQLDLGLGLGLQDVSTISPTCTNYPLPDTPSCRLLFNSGSAQPGVSPMQIDACGAPSSSANFCAGFHVSGATGNIEMQGGSTLRLPTIISAPGLATDAQGNVIAGIGGGSSINPIYTMRALPNNYTFVPADFVSCVTFTNSVGTPIVVNLPATPPPSGQCIKIINWGTGVVTINTNGNTVNGTTASANLPGIITSVTFTNSATYISTGTAYIVERTVTNIPWPNILGGNLINVPLTIGTGASLSVLGTGTINANRINGAAVPVSAASLASDANGALIAGTAGAATAWSSIGPAAADSSVALANFRTVWQPSFAGDNTGGTSIQIQQTGTTGTGNVYYLFGLNTSATNVSPFNFTNSTGNGIRMQTQSQGGNIVTQGTSKFVGPVQLTGLNSAPTLATDATGNIIQGAGNTAAYTQVFTNVPMIGSAGPVPGLPGCSLNTPFLCTAVSPTVNTSYRTIITVTQTAPGTGCTTQGSWQFWINYTDPDNQFSVANLPLAFVGIGGTTYSSNMTSGANNSGGNMFTNAPVVFRVQGGTTFTYRVQQTVATAGCNPQPTFTIRMAMFGDTGLQ